MRSFLGEALRGFRDAGNCVLGICNGFQVLLQTGLLLPDNFGATAKATLTINDVGFYQDRWVQLEVASEKCVFLSGIHQLYLPVAHAEGKFFAEDQAILTDLARNDQIALRYATPGQGDDGEVGFPANPNGSLDNIAGICDESGRVFGLMPHPERFVHRTQHPRWTREQLPEAGDGLQIFKNVVNYSANSRVSAVTS